MRAETEGEAAPQEELAVTLPMQSTRRVHNTRYETLGVTHPLPHKGHELLVNEQPAYALEEQTAEAKPCPMCCKLEAQLTSLAEELRTQNAELRTVNTEHRKLWRQYSDLRENYARRVSLTPPFSAHVTSLHEPTEHFGQD